MDKIKDASNSSEQTLKMTKDDWYAKGVSLFGQDVFSWRFVCPMCGNVQTPRDFKKFRDRGANPNSALTECIGRYLPKNQRGGLSPDHSNPKIKSPCDYAACGFFQLSNLIVDGQHIFRFEEPTQMIESPKDITTVVSLE